MTTEKYDSREDTEKHIKRVGELWSEHYKAVKELCRLCREYPEEADYFDVMEIY